MISSLRYLCVSIIIISGHLSAQPDTYTGPAGISAFQSSALFINEFMSNDVLTVEFPDGSYNDWIEIYNSGDSPVDLSGYYLTDNIASGKFFKIPPGNSATTTVAAKGHIILIADNAPSKGPEHLGFKISSTSGQLALIAPDGKEIIDSISYSTQLRDISFGRFPDGGSRWFYIKNITPGAANSQGYTGYTPEPVISTNSGFYSGSVLVTVQPSRSGDKIRYTTDESDPSESSALYTVPVEINATAVFRAREFNSGDLPGSTASRTYFINASHTLPVLSLVTDPKNLFDPKTGIYVNDKDGRAWERSGDLEYFKDGKSEFAIPCGLRIQGNTGPSDYDKKSFRTFFRDGYGKSKLKYSLYPGSTVKAFSKLVLRAGYDDSMLPKAGTKSTLLRDPVVSELWRQSGELVSASSFCVLYFGKNPGSGISYGGIYDIKESIDENFIKDHEGYADLDMIRTRFDSTELVYGSRAPWRQLVSFFSDNTFENDGKLAEAESLMDLDNFITLQALAHAADYYGWGYGTFMYRDKTPGAKWKWTIWDGDRAISDATRNQFTNVYSTTGVFLDNLITKKLLKNAVFKNRFISRVADLLNTVFLPENFIKIIDSLAGSIAAEIPSELSAWPNTSYSEVKWLENVDLLRSFASARPSILRSQMQSFFKLQGQAALNVNIAQGKGRIKVNSIIAPSCPWNGEYFTGVPVTLTAIPDPGYSFAGWSDEALPDSSQVTFTLSARKSVSAIFAKSDGKNAELITPKRISKGRYLPVIVRVRNPAWQIDPVDQTPVTLAFGKAHQDTSIKIKRGAGTGFVRIDSAGSFVLSLNNGSAPLLQKKIDVSEIPSVSYSGSLPAGDIIWDSGAERVITSDLSIPSGCHLTIKEGTVVILKKFVNIHISGRLNAEGTEAEPVFFTSEDMSKPWGGIDFTNSNSGFKYCIVMNGGGDISKGHPTNEDWHTGHQHIFFGKDNSELSYDQCFFLYSPGKVFGAQDSKVTVKNSVSSFVWLGGEFHRTLLNYSDSHLMNLPNDDHIFTEDIDTDGFHIDYINSKYPQYSVIERCYFVTGKDDAIDHHFSRLKISDCWLEDFIHEGVAASGGDTVKIYNTVSLNNDQGFEAGWTESGAAKGPYVFIDHCVAVNNNTGLRIGDSYDWTYKDYMNVTNSVIYNNKDNIRNYLNSTHAALAGALDISYSMTNDPEYDNSLFCITGIPQFDAYYRLLPASPGKAMGKDGSDMGIATSYTGIKGNSSVSKPGSFVLRQNYPNPFNPVSVIEYELPSSGHVTLEVFNILGQKTAEPLTDAVQSAGIHLVRFDASHLSSGVYLYRITFADGHNQTYSMAKKMLLAK